MYSDKIKKFRRGQSLVEILIALGIGVLLIGAIATILTANLKSSLNIKTTQAVASFSQELLDSVKSWASADWHNISGLAHGSGNPYYLVNSSVTSSIAITGQESIFVNDINSGLVGYWKFDEATGTNAYDSSGNFNIGTLVNGPVVTGLSSCKAGNCLNFNGTNNYITIPNNSSLELRTGITISLWTKQSGTIDSTTQRTLAGKNGEAYLAISYGQSRFTVYAQTAPGGCGGGSYCQAMGGTILFPNTWYHIVGTFDGQNIKIYENGVLKSTTSWVTNIADSGSYPMIGGNISGYSQGLIDDVRIYNRALSASEVQALYNNFSYLRYFYVDNVNRDSCGMGNISASATTTCTFGGAGISDDPSTQKITSIIKDNNNNNTLLTQSEYITRSRNYSFNQNNWSGGSGQNGVVIQPNSLFSSSTNINYASGTLQLILP